MKISNENTNKENNYPSKEKLEDSLGAPAVVPVINPYPNLDGNIPYRSQAYLDQAPQFQNDQNRNFNYNYYQSQNNVVPNNYNPQPNTHHNFVVVLQQPVVNPAMSQFNNLQVDYTQKSYGKYPSLTSDNAIIILIINICFPGLGTMIMGCLSRHPCFWIFIGFVQMFFAFLICGWIWAIYTGFQCLNYSKKNVIVVH